MNYEKRKDIYRLAVILILIGLTLGLFGYFQKDHLEAPVTKVTENTVVFEAYNGNLYVWEEVNADQKYKVGDVWKVDFFDFEDCDAENNIITKVRGKVE